MKNLVAWPTLGFGVIACLVAILLAINTTPPEASTANACDAKLKVDVASSPISQIPAGTEVTHRVRVVSSPCGTYSNVVLTFDPPAQALVSTGNTGPWNCAPGDGDTLVCTRDSFPTGKSSTLTLTYVQEPYQDSLGRARACVDSSETTENCQSAYSTRLP